MRRSVPRRAFLALSLAALAAGGCAPALAGSLDAPTTVMVFRHAERASDTDRDSPLSPAGEERARALADALADAGVTAVYVTEFQRTRNTARPLAERVRAEVRQQPAGTPEESAAALAALIRNQHAGESVLVVGHSNTVPLIVRALGGRAPDLASGDYGDLFVVVLPPGAPARTLRTRVGR